MNESANILISGVNWLGDSCMTMPAIQLFKKRRSTTRLSILAKPSLVSLWRMHAGIDQVIPIEDGPKGTLATSRKLRSLEFDSAYIFPNSWRSALIPRLSGIPVRIGYPGHCRAVLLTQVAHLPHDPPGSHQMWEYVHLLGLHALTDELEAPSLDVSRAGISDVRRRFGMSAEDAWVGVLPGAARGPSKRWPADYFVETGRNLMASTGCRISILGTEGEAELCEVVATGIGGGARSLAGRTSIPELAALLGTCQCVICNDSGGMHLAAAAGATVVAIYGLTDPSTTGPIGHGHKVIEADTVAARSRSIKRDSREAEQALRSIAPARVCAAVTEVMSKQ